MPRNPSDTSRRIRFGPYAPPRVHVGDEIVCEIRGKVLVADWSDRPGIMWPRCKTSGHRALIVCDDLIRAMRRECQEAVGAHWGVAAQTVCNWARQLGMNGRTEGSIAVASERARRQLTGKPAYPQTRDALLRAASRPKGRRWKLMLSARNRLRALDDAKATTAYDAERIRRILEAVAGGATEAEVARELGVTRQAVHQAFRKTTTRRERAKGRRWQCPRCDCGAYSDVYAKQIGHTCAPER